ncbi:MAG: hypothetical protein ACP6IQ_01840 [Candidatus Njordarchaeia archaeon]
MDIMTIDNELTYLWNRRDSLSQEDIKLLGRLYLLISAGINSSEDKEERYQYKLLLEDLQYIGSYAKTSIVHPYRTSRGKFLCNIHGRGFEYLYIYSHGVFDKGGNPIASEDAKIILRQANKRNIFSYTREGLRRLIAGFEKYTGMKAPRTLYRALEQVPV